MARPNEHGPRGNGNLYYCVKTNLGTETGEIYLWADKVRLDPTGCIAFYGGPREDLNMAFAAGSWEAVYSASALDGSPVAVEIWRGEISD